MPSGVNRPSRSLPKPTKSHHPARGTRFAPSEGIVTAGAVYDGRPKRSRWAPGRWSPGGSHFRGRRARPFGVPDENGCAAGRGGPARVAGSADAADAVCNDHHGRERQAHARAQRRARLRRVLEHGVGVVHSHRGNTSGEGEHYGQERTEPGVRILGFGFRPADELAIVRADAAISPFRRRCAPRHHGLRA